MVELVVERLEGRLDVREIHDPARGFPDGARDVEAEAEAVAVEAAALVAVRDVRQAVGGFEREFFEDLRGNSHRPGSITPAHKSKFYLHRRHSKPKKNVMATYTYPAHVFNQFSSADSSPSGKLIHFSAPAREIQQWAGVPRKSWTLRALYQRVLDETRLDRISHFFAKSGDKKPNLSPTSITIAVQKIATPDHGSSFDLSFAVPTPPDTDNTIGELARLAQEIFPQHLDRLEKTAKQAIHDYVDGSMSIDEVPEFIDADDYVAFFVFDLAQLSKDTDRFLAKQGIQKKNERLPILESLYELTKPALIIDGQHRVLGGALVPDQDINFLVCCIPECKWEDQAFQFIVINEEAKPVETTILYDIFGSSLTRTEARDVRTRLGSAGRSVEKKIAAAVTARDTNSPFLNMVQLKVDDVPDSIEPYLSPRLIVDLIDGSRSVRGFRKDGEFVRMFVEPSRVDENDLEWWKDWNEGKWRDYWYALWTAVREYFNSDNEKLWSTTLTGRRNLTKGVALKALQTVIMDEILRTIGSIQSQMMSLREIGVEENKIQQLVTNAILPASPDDFRQLIKSKYLAGFPHGFFSKNWEKSLDTASGLETLMTVMKETWSSYVGEGGSKKYPYWRNAQIFADRRKDNTSPLRRKETT